MAIKIKPISIRLIIMNFLQYAVWGAYLTAMGSFIGSAGMGKQVWLFYASQGFVSIFMPALMGIVADKWIQAQKTLAICHGLAAVFMIALGVYAMGNTEVLQNARGIHYYSTTPGFSFAVFYVLYLLSVAFYMPTIAISNSVAYKCLENEGMDTVKDFPPIRVFGTIGFICAMLFVNFMRDPNNFRFQHSYWQFLTSGALGLILCAYAFFLPKCPVKQGADDGTIMDKLGLSAFKLFKSRQFAIFFIFSMLLGASLQITNGYANMYISSFRMIPEFKATWGAQNANALISLSQVSEVLCILLIPFCMKKFGIKKVMLIAMFAWVFRFGFFGLGNPGGGVWLFVLSCIVYGVAFDFFNISGSLYVNQNTDKSIQSSAQGLFMLMTNGLGASIGTWAAGKVVNHYVMEPMRILRENPAADVATHWDTAWYIFAAYAFLVGFLFMILFKDPEKQKKAAA
ncbi:MAG: MFS transporter [Bacteroidales bacterium]|nr:MFS transporter [Bacteroidales bacterium]